MIGNGWQRFATIAAGASVVALGACGGGDDTVADTTNVAGITADSAAGALAPAPAPTPTPTMAITGGDPEVLQFLATVDVGEIEAGRLAQKQARNAEVKSFARTLVTEHQRSLRQDRNIAQAANITLDSALLAGTSGTGSAGAAGTTPGSTSAVASQVSTMHQQAMQHLQSLQAADFDSAFMNAQVMMHQQVLDVLRGAQAQAQDSTVQQHLTKVTESVQKHLDRARELQQAVMTGGTGSGTAGDTSGKGRTGSDTGRRG